MSGKNKKNRKKRTGAHTAAAAAKYRSAAMQGADMKTAEEKEKKGKRLTRKAKLVIFAAVCAACVIGLAAALIINVHVKNTVEEYIITPEDAAGMEADCVMVLGCGLTDDGEPGRNLTRRLEAGLAIYENGAGRKLMMSGDHGRVKYDEVNAMKGWATARGVDSPEVFMDHAGFSTYESMYRARDVFDVESVVIVSQKYHLYRALYDARSLGLEAYGVAAEGGSGIRNDFRELLARSKDWIWCIIQPEPKYLGEVIAISGSGDLTNDRVVSEADISSRSGNAAIG